MMAQNHLQLQSQVIFLASVDTKQVYATHTHTQTIYTHVVVFLKGAKGQEGTQAPAIPAHRRLRHSDLESWASLSRMVEL